LFFFSKKPQTINANSGHLVCVCYYYYYYLKKPLATITNDSHSIYFLKNEAWYIFEIFSRSACIFFFPANILCNVHARLLLSVPQVYPVALVSKYDIFGTGSLLEGCSSHTTSTFPGRFLQLSLFSVDFCKIRNFNE
jgi:hypothetical protein